MSALRRLSKQFRVSTSGPSKSEPDSKEVVDTSPSGNIVSSPSPLSPQSPHRRSLATFLHFKPGEIPSSSSDEESDSNWEDEGQSKNAVKRARARERKAQAKSRLSHEISETDEQAKARLEQAQKEETPDMKSRYGTLPLMQSTTRNTENRIHFEDITPEMVGTEITFRARLHHVRRMGPKLVFVMLRQQINILQGVLFQKTGAIGPLMIHWVEHLHVGSIVKVTGVVQKPETPIKSATNHEVEILVTRLNLIVPREAAIPFSVQEAELQITDENGKVEGRQSQISDRTRLANRVLDLRTATSQSIFRIQAGVGNLFRYSLDERGFTEIHSPKLQGAATESGASVFKVNYFGRDAFLAQSPQLAKQLAIAADFERVYEIGPVFRAENSNTHRHLTEFTGLDLEMTIEEHYHEMMDVIDATLKNIFNGIYTRYRREVDIIKHQFPSDDLLWLEKTPIFAFKDAIQMLTDSGWLSPDGEPLSPLDDFSTRDEIRFGQLVREKYNTDYYIVDKFPRAVRPFYTMPDPTDDRYTNSFDVFVRGQEIISGGQRIHDTHLLEDNMRNASIEPEDMAEYMEGFKMGAPPHAGCGIGLERLVLLILKLGNIRLSSLLHRDPKSFPAKTNLQKLPHPDSDTLKPNFKDEKGHPISLANRKMPPLENLIANYGDATATSWGDERYKIWRHAETGAAVAYVPEGHHAILPGDPLCHPSQYTRVISAFLHWLGKETGLKPIWILINPEVEEVLGEKLGWKSLSCVAEERVDPSMKKAEKDPEVSRKIRKAQAEGVKITDWEAGKPVSDDLKERTNARVKDWLSNRKGQQIHLSNIDLFRDEAHRRYFIAEDKNNTIVGVAVLAQLSPAKGWQAKYTLDFPNAPSGTIEYLTTHALAAADAAGIKRVTFGGGAAPRLTPGHHMSGAKVMVLQATYDTLVKQFNLARKSEFREKMGAVAEPTYIAYPRKGLGGKGIKAIMAFFQDE